MKGFIFILFSLLVSCVSTPHIRNSEVVVEYNGIVEAKSDGKYADEATLKKMLKDESKEHYIVFSTSWCGGCVDLDKALKERGWEKKVTFLNFEEQWVVDLARIMEINAVPIMIVELANEKGALRFEGTSQIMMYLARKL
jgi:thiol-disulfide isomerase/thioredoxin